jgi:enoyl-CoA hydratase
MDLKAYRETPVSSGSAQRSDLDRVVRMRETFDAWERLDVPCIAAIKGYCLGAALELCLCLDIRICDEKAQFGLPEMGVGGMPDMGSTQRLPRLVGMGMAREMVYTTRRIDAETALRLGLVNHVYPTEEVVPEALKLAAEIAQFPPHAVQNAKRALNAAFSAPLAVGLELESALSRVGRRRPNPPE